MYLMHEIVNDEKREFTLKEIICILLEELIELLGVMLNNISFSTSDIDESDNELKKNILRQWHCHLYNILNEIKSFSDNEMKIKGVICLNDLNLLSSSIKCVWGWGYYPNKDVIDIVYNKILIIMRFIRLFVE